MQGVMEMNVPRVRAVQPGLPALLCCLGCRRLLAQLPCEETSSQAASLRAATAAANLGVHALYQRTHCTQVRVRTSRDRARDQLADLAVLNERLSGKDSNEAAHARYGRGCASSCCHAVDCCSLPVGQGPD